MLGKASESCDVFSFGVTLLELASGRRPVEKLSPTTSAKQTVTEWALPLARARRFGEIADPKLDGGFVQEELKRVVLVGLVCAQDRPELRPTMSEVVQLLKGESAEKLDSLENDDLFKPGGSSFQSSDCVGEGEGEGEGEGRSPGADGGIHIQEAVDSSETVSSAS
jgi:hypothetical protein